ncbi:hypothetical protein AB4037_23285 [Labrys sp. KB_33_2]|uniref:hypothetical protein n=1 Tax=Labrys sp. KB_33_2 TaxID=3237479 RepID=UPI003F9263B1
MITEKMIEAAWSAYGEEFKRARSAATNSTTNTDIERSAWKAALEAAERAAWRPESEARDGSRMLVCFPPIRRPRVNWGHVRIGRWAGASWHLDMPGSYRSDVTLVRPLPSPPEAP